MNFRPFFVFFFFVTSFTFGSKEQFVPVIKTPIIFTENNGQYQNSPSARILFKAEATGTSIFLTEKGLSYYFLRSRKLRDTSVKSCNFGYCRFDIELKGADIRKENIVKEEECDFSYNFIYPHCPKGIYGTKAYGRLTVKDIYPGIDWVLYTKANNSFKYDFIIHPGADAKTIRLLYRTLHPLQLENGDIKIRSEDFLFSEQAPVSSVQETFSNVQSDFLILDIKKKQQDAFSFYETEIGFQLDTYAKDRTLVIDPLQLWWGTYFGGAALTEGVSICNDSLGNVFVLGNTRSTTLPLQSYGSLAYFQGNVGGAGNVNSYGDSFILKFTNTGQLIWSTYFGGSYEERAAELKCDKNGNLFMTGVTYSTDFPLKNPGGGAYFDSTNASLNSIDEIFVAKFSNNGQYLWGTYYGAKEKDVATALEVDVNGNLYVFGTTTCTDFPTYNPNNGGFFQGSIGAAPWYNNHPFILKFSNNGQLKLATYFGGNGDERAVSVTSDYLGNVYFCGTTTSSNLIMVNPGGGAYFQGALPTSANCNAYILKLNASGSLAWSTYLGGCCADWGKGVACDKKGNLFFTGAGNSYNFPLVNPGGGAYYLPGYFSSPVICKFSPSSQLLWSTRFRGAGDRIIVGNCNEIYVTAARHPGYFDSIPVKNPGLGAYVDSTYDNSKQVSLDDIFISSFSNSGIYRWGTFFGGNGIETSMILSCDKHGNIFYTGRQGACQYFTLPDLQTYTANCLANPGNNTYFQSLPFVQTSSVLPAFGGDDVCVVGKFTGPSFTTSFSSYGCGNTNTAIAHSSGGWGPYTYNWSTGSQNDSIANVPPGMYTYTVTDQFFGCQNTNTVYLGLPSLTLNIQSSANTLCSGQSAIISVQGANNFSWSPASVLNTNSGSSVIATPLTNTEFTITGYNSPTCSTDSLLQLVVHPLPVLLAAYSDSVCYGSKVDLSVSGALTYSWLPQALFANAFQDSVTFMPTQDETLLVIGKDSNNCIDSLGLHLKVIPVPTLSISGPTAVCSGNSATLHLSGAQSFNWKPSLNTFYSDSTGLIISPFTSATNYSLVGNNQGTCYDSLVYSISLLQLPDLMIERVDSICPDLSFELVAKGQGNFTWSSPGFLECATCKTSPAKIMNDTWIYCELTDQNSCSSLDSSFVQIKKDCDPVVIIPNIFTPNNDNINDFFKVTGKNFNNFSCDIVNRWGTVLSSFKSMDDYWDGKTPEGKESADAVYLYVIRLSDVWGKEHVYRGTIQLIR